MKVLPYYSFIPSITAEEFWHDNDECEIGRSLASAERMAGTDHILKYCWVCAALNRPILRPKFKI